MMLYRMYLIILICCFCIPAKAQNFSFVLDTINPQIWGDLKSTLHYKGNYYAFYQNESIAPLGKRFYILSGTGQVKDKVELPDEIEKARYYDLHLRNDSIVVKISNEGKTFYLNGDEKKWEEIPTVDDIVFEDSEYYVTYLDFGEWAGKLWFKDKKTGIEYEISSGTPNGIHNHNGMYYITTSDRIFVIKDPTKMQLSLEGYTYSDIRKDNGKFFKSVRSIQGSDYIYPKNFDEDTVYIAKSFVYRNKLYCIIASDGVYLCEINDGELRPLQKFPEDIILCEFPDSYRNYAYKAVSFVVADRTMRGFIEIDNDLIKLHYIKCLDTH